MALSKVTYVDGVTIIGAKNLNDIQDELIANGTNIGDLTELETTDKTDLVSSINEVKGDIPSVPSPSDANPQMDGTAAAGSSVDYSRADHVHPTDTSRADADEVADLKAMLVEESYNKYSKALQTSETISPHYYVSGVPYQTTQFDSTYNCTALIPVKPNTTYTVGLVPAYNGITNPWNNATNRGWSYDENGNYIAESDWSSNTFTTPANAKYIRFNYYIGGGNVTLSRLNARCMLVEGSALPASYFPYEEKNKIEEIQKNLPLNNLIEYKYSSGTLSLLFGYGSTNILMTMVKNGGNSLFEFDSFYTVPKGIAIDDITDSDKTTIQTAGGDWHAPFQVKAVNNIDGDNINSGGNYRTYFTGGNHQYNNTGSGSTATARTTSVSVKANGVDIADGESGVANIITIKWKNRVQGFNTTKADGSGREIIEETHIIEFDGFTFNELVQVTALEDVVLSLWYGFQMVKPASKYPNVRYIGATNKGVYNGNIASESGNIPTNAMMAYGDIHKMVIGVDVTTDVGKRENVPSGNSGFFTTAYSKSYANIIKNNVSLTQDDAIYLKGFYKFCSAF